MRSVLITGAYGGLGRELVRTFSPFEKVFAQGRAFNPNFSEDDAFGSVTRIYADLSDVIALREMKSRFFENEEGLDILINNAAIYLHKPFEQMTIYDIHDTINVNLKAPILLSSMLWEKLKRKKGIIVNINSLAGKYGAQGESLYCATKHGLSGFSKALQFDATAAGIQVVNIYCGAMKTKMSDTRADWNKFISPEEVAAEVFHLCENRESLRVTEIELMRNQY